MKELKRKGKISRRIWWPIIKGDVASQRDGTKYLIRDDGWRRIR